MERKAPPLDNENMSFPVHRPRRLRVSESMRRLVRETHLEPSQFILPLFAARAKASAARFVHARQFQLSIDELVKECEGGSCAGRRRRHSIRNSANRRTKRPPAPTTKMASCSKPMRAVKREVPGAARHHRRLQLRIHQPRPLRQDRRTAKWITTATLEWLAAAAVSHARAGRRHRRALAT